MKSDLQELALNIYEICIFNNINIELEWIPRNGNIQADFFSKIFDFDDWSVADHIFQMLNKKWGNFTFDRFADNNNCKVDNFNSKFWVSGTNGVDAFAFDWSSDNNWIVPPVSLVCKAINHMFLCKAKGVLVLPKWKSALFWPIVWNHSENYFHNFVKDFIEFYRPKQFY